MFNYVKKKLKPEEVFVKYASVNYLSVQVVVSIPLLLCGGVFVLTPMALYYLPVGIFVAYDLHPILAVICGFVSCRWVARDLGLVAALPALFIIPSFWILFGRAFSGLSYEHLDISVKVWFFALFVVFFLCGVVGTTSIELALTTKRLIGKTRFDGETLVCPLNEIVSVSVERGRGLLGRFSGGRTICVKTASDTLLFNYIEYAEEFKDIITAEIDKYKEASGKQQEAA